MLNNCITGRTVAHLDEASLASYREFVRMANPALKAVDAADEVFCEHTGICRNRELTYAGLLFLGKADILRMYVNNFWIDYVEMGAGKPSSVLFRLSELGNIWNAYQAVMSRLFVHPDCSDPRRWAILREGLVNCLSYADYFAPMHPVVRLFPDRISFRNPGRLSASAPVFIHHLFVHCGLAGNARAGLSLIRSWEEVAGKKVSIDTNHFYTELTFFRGL